MTLRTLWFATAATTLLASQAYAADPAQCTLNRVAALDADTSHGRLLIKIQINGTDAWAQVDTGSPFNMISTRLVEALKLREISLREGAARDGSGTALKHMVKVEELKLEKMTASNVPFIVMGESGNNNNMLDGVFGANFLAAYEIELDIPHGKVNLFTKDHCKGRVVYWTENFTAVPFTMDASMHPVLHASLDGHVLTAMLDTGATPSVLSAQVARGTFDFDPAAQGLEPDGKIIGGSGATMPYYRHRFTTFEIGGVTFHNTEFEIIPDKVSRIIRDQQQHGVPMLDSEQNKATPLVIGLHHLAKLRAFIAYSEEMIYISAGDAK